LKRPVIIGLVLTAAALAAVTTTVLRSGPAAAPACTVTSSSTGSRFKLSPAQAQNAAIISAVGIRMGMPDHAVTVALATSLQETRLQNLPYGDRDSVGLFQQRPSEGWGTVAQIMDPAYAAAAFYSRLTHVPGWETMTVAEAAQAVQISAAPTAYATWEEEGRSLAIAFTGEVPAGLSCRFSRFGGAVPDPSALGQALTSELGSDPIGSPVPAKSGWQVAAWAVAHAYNYHMSRVGFAGLTWTPGRGWSGRPGAGNVVTVG
jgi:hypothetical protein